MKCEQCGTDMFYKIDTISTLLGCQPNRMIDGKMHRHDLNRHNDLFVCKNGHELELMYRDLCPVRDCEWNEKLKRLAS